MHWMTNDEQVEYNRLLKKKATKKARDFCRDAAIKYVVREARIRNLHTKVRGSYAEAGEFLIYGSKVRRRSSNIYGGLDPVLIVSLLDQRNPLKAEFFDLIRSLKEEVGENESDLLEAADDILNYVKAHGPCDPLVMKHTMVLNHGGENPTRVYYQLLRFFRRNGILTGHSVSTINVKDPRKANVIWALMLDRLS